MVTAIGNELKAYNKSALQYAQIAYDPTLSCYALSFNVKKGSVKYNPTYYLDLVSVDEETISFTAQAEGDRYGEVYAKNCPTMRAFVDAMAKKFDLSANSLLAPVNMKTSESGNHANYVIWNLQ